MKHYFVSKLVRDGLYHQKATSTSLSPDLAIIALKEKLLEEAAETLQTTTPEDLENELGDVLDIIDALAQKAGLSLETINQKRAQKKAQRGGFDRALFIKEIALEDDSPLNEGFSNPCKYPPLTPLHGEFKLGKSFKGAPTVNSLLQSRLRAFNTEKGGKTSDPFTFFITLHGHVIGGISGMINQSVLQIFMLIVEEKYRSQNFGNFLLTEAENHGKSQGCNKAVVDTFDFQARPFYEKNGYLCEATVHGWYGKHARYYLYKNL